MMKLIAAARAWLRRLCRARHLPPPAPTQKDNPRECWPNDYNVLGGVMRRGSLVLGEGEVVPPPQRTDIGTAQWVERPGEPSVRLIDRPDFEEIMDRVTGKKESGGRRR